MSARPASIGAYTITDELGRGGMGVVYTARAADGTQVAVKVLGRFVPPEAVARFRREARLQGALSLAQGFVPVLETGETPSGPYIVMPLIPGGTLRSRIRAGGLAVAEALSIARTLARAVGEAHARGVVHRDLKPENVLFTEEGRPLIADLGLARHFRDDVPGASRSVTLSKTGELRGSLGYMPVEQLHGARDIGPPADVFAIGVMLYESLVGDPPFRSESMLELVALTEEGKYEPVGASRRDVPAWVSAVIDRALDRDPAKRFADGDALARALEGPDTTLPAGRRSRASLVLLGALGATAVGAAAAGLARSPFHGSSSPSRAASPASTSAPGSQTPDLVIALDAVSLERARHMLGAAKLRPEALDEALARAVESGAARGDGALQAGLAAIARSELPRGPRLAAAALTAVDRAVAAELGAEASQSGDQVTSGAVSKALALVRLAADLGLRFEHGIDGDRLLDRFYRPALESDKIAVRWREILCAFVDLDVLVDNPHLDLVKTSTVFAGGRSFAERYLEARARALFSEDRDDSWDARWLRFAARSEELLRAGGDAIGPRTRASILVCESYAYHGRERIARLERAVELDPQSVRRRYDLAAGLGAEGSSEEAIAPARAALELARRQAPLPSSYVVIPHDCEELIRRSTESPPK